jgi:hypothetical protein
VVDYSAVKICTSYFDPLYSYLYGMKNEITIPLPKEEDFVAANKRRDQYALKRDMQALEYNQAIAARLLSEAKNQLKCEKCGKEIVSGTITENTTICSDCR